MTEQVLAEQRIGQNTEVTLHFALRLENGDTVDSTFDKAPATFQVGDGNHRNDKFSAHQQRPSGSDTPWFGGHILAQLAAFRRDLTR